VSVRYRRAMTHSLLIVHDGTNEMDHRLVVRKVADGVPMILAGPTSTTKVST
jgi:hypothetical protein